MKANCKTFANYYLVLFIISTLFPIIASLSYIKPIQALMGIMDTIPLFLLLLFFTGVQIKWDVLIIGLAWRMFLFAMVLPYLLDLLNPEFKDNMD